ncbi:MAG: hypothetical protein WC277_06320 [Bacilli bacterium]
MIKKTILQALACCLLSAFAARAEPIAELVTVRDGQIYPSNTVAAITDLATSAASVQAALATATATQAAALMISNELAVIRDLEAARNSTGYIRGFVESFSAGIVADTNMTASIIAFERAGTDATKAYYDLFTFFSEDPGSWPTVTTAESAGRTNAWDLATTESVILTNKIVGATDYECYRNRISMPLDSTTAFFRVQADITGIGTNATYFPVQGGIAVNGKQGVTVTIIDGDKTMQWIGGVRVQ